MIATSKFKTTIVALSLVLPLAGATAAEHLSSQKEQPSLNHDDTALLADNLELQSRGETEETATTEAFEAPYLGQEPPGTTPELFAPGLVSTDALEIEGVFSPDMREFYFTRQGEDREIRTHVIKYQNGTWQESHLGARTGEVFISTDGNTMYLGSKYRERTPEGWSDQKGLGPDLEEIPVMRLTASADGTYVFDERDEVGAIRYSRVIDGKRETPKAFGAEINTGTFIGHPFIAPDESYIIFDTKRDDGYGDSDLYISYRQDDGSYGDAINLGAEINTDEEDAYGSVTPDGKYFIFHTINLEVPKANIFWVDAGFIEELRPN